jgi:tRNA(adenine34) deaminase
MESLVSSESPLRVPGDDDFMAEALKEARLALAEDEVPVGTVIVQGGRIVARAHNQRERLNDPTAHAEMIALTQASSSAGRWRLTDMTIYVTLEPCAMCAGALVLARMGRLVFGTRDPKAGACGSVYNIVQDARLNHRVELTEGVLEQQCSDLLKQFFQKRRGPCSPN